MSYTRVANEESSDTFGNSRLVSHRNPIYPTLKYPPPAPTQTLESEITSSLLLQQLLYFNWYYSVLFLVLYSASQVQRVIYFEWEFGVPIRFIVVGVYVVLEASRLQNGSYGNIKESFPEICAFIMLTFLTLVAQFFLIAGPLPASPLEWSLLLYGILFQFAELLVCVFGMGTLTQTQKALFLWRNPASAQM